MTPQDDTTTIAAVLVRITQRVRVTAVHALAVPLYRVRGACRQNTLYAPDVRHEENSSPMQARTPSDLGAGNIVGLKQQLPLPTGAPSSLVAHHMLGWSQHSAALL